MSSFFRFKQQYHFVVLNIMLYFLGAYTSAITLTIPPSDGFQDIAVTGPQQIEGQSNFIYYYIQLATQYLWFFMIVVCFIALIYLGFKLITNPAGSNDIKKIMKDTAIGFIIGLVIAMMSYTIVRLVINIL